MNIDLSGIRILVTGASRGIGLAITKQLLESGAVVVAHYNRNSQNLDKLKKSYNSSIEVFQADLSDASQVIDLFNRSSKAKIDGVVLNAGVAFSSSIDDPIDQWYADWRKTMEINLDAVGVLTKLFVRYFRDHNGGRMVYIASRASHRGDTLEYMAYGASKAGMANLIKTVARYEGKNNIKAFGIAPGFTRTEMAQDFIDHYGEGIVLDDIALNELTKPEDISPMVLFLLSGKADHATGSIIDINAGSYVR